MRSCVEEISEVPKFQRTGMMLHDDATWTDVDLIESSEDQRSRVLKCVDEKFFEVPETRSLKAPGKNCSKVRHSGVMKYVGVKYSKSRSVKVLECQSDVAWWSHLEWRGPVWKFDVWEFLNSVVEETFEAWWRHVEWRGPVGKFGVQEFWRVF